jgi:FtsP/CotA-like multicopper oxidase with cupredoxin domain
MVTRRDLLKMGILGVGGFVTLPAGGVYGRVPSKLADDDFRSPRLTPFVDPLIDPTVTELAAATAFTNMTAYATPFCGAQTRYYGITAMERLVKFHRDLPPTPVWAYVDSAGATSSRLFSFSYPRIDMGRGAGSGVLVRFRNALTTAPADFGLPSLTVHFHGGHQPAAADGFPHDIANRPGFVPEHVVVDPGETYDYVYPWRDVGFLDTPETPVERGSFYWYHDHILDFTGPNVYRGLAGVALAYDEIDSGNENDTNPYALRLPSGQYDIPFAIQDKIFDRSGALVFDPFNHDGFLGDTFVVNGIVQPYHPVERRKYRLRFLNGSNARIYQLYLTNDSGQTFPMTQIATEGGLLGEPIRDMQNFLLHMAQRVEVVVDFGHPVFDGQSAVYIENRLTQTDGRKPDDLESRGPKLIKFILGARTDDPSRVPNTLRPFARVTDAEIAAAERKTFRFDRSDGVFTVNNERIDIERASAKPRQNRAQIWRLENNSGGWWHPIHIHSEFMRILSRNGRKPPLEERDGNAKKDTVLLRGNEVVEVFITFRDYPGPFVFHCHNIEHEDMAMMARYDVV